MENDHSPDARRKGEENPISLRPAYLTDPEEAEKDAASREAIARKLAEALDQKGAKALVGNRGYAQFLKVSKAGTHIGMSRMLPTERERNPEWDYQLENEPILNLVYDYRHKFRFVGRRNG